MSQYTINNSRDCLNTTNSYNTTVSNYYTVGDDLAPLLEWLSPLDPGLRHSDIQERRIDNVGEWLMETEKFRRWRGLNGEFDDDREVLFCYGNPGVGKTFVSSLVVDKLCDQMGGQHTAVTCFYFDFAARKEQTATSMLGSVLKQVISGTERVPEDIWLALQKQKKAVSGRKPQLGDIVKILQLITSSQRTFMVIDALDESTAVQRFRLFDSLQEILRKSPGARIFVTGRPHICPEIEMRLAGRVTSLCLGPNIDDIVGFLRVRLREDETPDAMDENLEAEILEKIPGNISGMFLLASLNIEAILQESTIHRRRERLSKITDGLGLEDVYGATIERIKAQGGDKSRLGMGALMWISYAEEPLSPDELCHALAIELGSTDFNADNIPSITTLVGCCQGLVTVDKEESNVRLIHFTLREYFSSHPDIFSRHHSRIAEMCLTYLNSQQVKALSPNPSTNVYAVVSDQPFLRYCSLYWGAHAKMDLSDCARSLALELLRESSVHISAVYLLEREIEQDRFATIRLFNGLHWASLLGIVEIVAALIQTGCYDLNGGGYRECPPLLLAARKGHEEVVKILLGREEVDPDKPDDIGRTPLSYAAQEGHEGVVKTLLRLEGVAPHKPDMFGRTPLSHAAEHGRVSVLEILLEWEEVDSDKPDMFGRTPLSHAAERGRVGVLEILLEREEVYPDEPDMFDRTPLSHAAQRGWVEAVEILLERAEIDPDKPDNRGLTPLLHAASGVAFDGYLPEHDEVVEILLDREEVNPDRPDNGGRTPLSRAAKDGRRGVVKILLGREEVNPDRRDNDGRTPLSYAVEEGRTEVVKILLGREEVNREKPDNIGKTPLMWAPGWRRREMVALLQPPKPVTHNAIEDLNGTT